MKTLFSPLASGNDLFLKLIAYMELVFIAINLFTIFLARGLLNGIPSLFLLGLISWIIWAWINRWHFGDFFYFMLASSYVLRVSYVIILFLTAISNGHLGNILAFNWNVQTYNGLIKIGDTSIPVWGFILMLSLFCVRTTGLLWCVKNWLKNEKENALKYISFSLGFVLLSHMALFLLGLASIILFSDLIGFYGFKIWI